MTEIKIRKAVLAGAWVELNFIKNRQFHQVVASGIRWGDVKEQLRRLDEAIENSNEHALKDATSILSRQLSNQEPVIRTIIDSKPPNKTQPLPPPIWEHLNRIVSRLHLELRLTGDVQEPKPLMSSASKSK